MNLFIILYFLVSIILLVDCSTRNPPLFLVLLKLSQAFIFASLYFATTQ